MAFGAVNLCRLDDEDGAVVPRVSVRRAEFRLADESPEHFNLSRESPGGGSVGIVVIVEDPDAGFERAFGPGAVGVWPVSNQQGWRVG